MTRVPMKASLTFAVGGGLAHKGEEFEAANEEDARLYEENGLAKRKDKKKEPERTQDVQSEEEPKRRGRPPKTRKTKGAGNLEANVPDVEEVADGGDKGSPDS